MKTFTIYALAAILLVGLTAATFAQNMTSDEAERQTRLEQNRQRVEAMAAAQRAMQRSPAMLQEQRNALKRMMNSFWHGEGSNLIAVDFLQQEYFREGIGVSEEQFQKIRSVPQSVMEGPDFQQYRDEMQKLMTEDGGPFGENATEEMRNRFVELQTQMSAKIQEALMEGMKKAVNENLTPEQLKKVQEAQISAMSEIPITAPNMFEALDLSDAQRRQLDEIKKEMEPEFDKHVDKWVDAQMKMMEKVREAFEKVNEITDSEEQQRFMQNLQENIRKANPDIQRAMNEAMESGKVFSDALKSKMFDVLTDEQWKRMVDLIDNPPEYMKKAIAEMRKEMGADDPQARSRQPGGGYVPGPGAWQPGSSAIPEQYRQERNSRFPRGGN